MHMSGLLAAVSALLLSDAAVAETPPWTMPPHSFGGAKPINRPSWFPVHDYPTSAMAGNHQGSVVVSFEIGSNGRVSQCRITRSSGYADLDGVPCPALQRRARFTPAVGADMQPIATVGTLSVPFWMP
jgi:periplasmic protein TonB